MRIGQDVNHIVNELTNGQCGTMYIPVSLGNGNGCIDFKERIEASEALDARFVNSDNATTTVKKNK